MQEEKQTREVDSGVDEARVVPTNGNHPETTGEINA
jgi:hypothetical protein